MASLSLDLGNLVLLVSSTIFYASLLLPYGWVSLFSPPPSCVWVCGRELNIGP